MVVCADRYAKAILNATESDLSLEAPVEGLPANEPYQPAVFAWTFGDGASVSGDRDQSVFHSYTYGGTYTVTLTITDSGGNVSRTTREITVIGPPHPSPSTTTSASSSVTLPAPNAVSAGGAPTPAPVAAAAVVSRSLRRAIRNGVLVNYSVSEQVAGHFEVLIPVSLAHRLGISGTPAVGLPAGSAPELVIARAVVVTASGGHSRITIHFSHRTGQRLGRMHSVPFMLRLIVHNAARSPVSATVLSDFTLN